MPADDLSGISGLDDRRRAVLADKLGITTRYELIMTDRPRIADAFGRRTIRPTLEDVAVWQDEARRMRAASIEAAVSDAAAAGWEPAATFVVAFEERRRGDALERRIVAEQNEVEPDASSQQRSEWPEWTCDDACRWMLESVAVPASADMPAPAQIAFPAEASAPETGAAETGASETGASETGAAAAPAAGIRPKLDVERVDLADSSGGAELVTGSSPVPGARLVWTQPARLLVTLGGGQAGSGASVVLQLVQAGGQKQNIAGHLDETGRVAEVELSGLADGEYTPTIVARTPDASFLPRIVKLPAVDVVGSATGVSGPP